MSFAAAAKYNANYANGIQSSNPVLGQSTPVLGANYKYNANYANGYVKGCFFLSPNEDPFELPVDSRIDTYSMLKKYFPRGFETHQIFMDDTQLEYISIFFDADTRGEYNSTYVAGVIASVIGISPTGNMLIWRKKWIDSVEYLVDMDMRFDEFFWRGIVGKRVRKSAYFLPPCCWDRDFIKKNLAKNGEVNIKSCDNSLVLMGNTREELKAKNDKKRKAKKAKKQQQTKEKMRECDAEWKEQEDMGQEDNNILTMMTRAMQEREERYLMECEDQPTFDFELHCREVLTIAFECLDFEARIDIVIADTFVYSLEELDFSNVVFML